MNITFKVNGPLSTEKSVSRDLESLLAFALQVATCHLNCFKERIAFPGIHSPRSSLSGSVRDLISTVLSCVRCNRFEARGQKDKI